MKQNQVQQKEIRLGTHGENYGSWMSNPVFYVVGALLALSVVLAVLSFTVFHITALGVVFVIAAGILLALLLWCAWIRRQYAFGGGGMMDRTHLVVLSHLNFDGQGSLLEVGCGSGALSIRAALTWPDAEVTGIDYWGAAYLGLIFTLSASSLVKVVNRISSAAETVCRLSSSWASRVWRYTCSICALGRNRWAMTGKAAFTSSVKPPSTSSVMPKTPSVTSIRLLTSSSLRTSAKLFLSMKATDSTSFS